jgi:type I restriction enzyme, R subunit
VADRIRCPCMHTLYIDKPMKGHNLMQAIARVNRVYKDKPGGLVVDYLGIASDLKEALSFYSESGGRGDPAIAQEQAAQLMLEKLEVVSQMFHGFAYEEFFEADTGKKLSVILAAEEHVLGLDNGKKRYIDEVTALSKAFSIAVPHEQAMDAKDEVGFFQAVKSRLAKFDGTGSGRTNEEVETAIRQVIDKALVSEQVIDVFDAAGIKKPDISILSEEFLLEVKTMEHKKPRPRGFEETAQRRNQIPDPEEPDPEQVPDGNAGGVDQEIPQQGVDRRRGHRGTHQPGQGNQEDGQGATGDGPVRL